MPKAKTKTKKNKEDKPIKKEAVLPALRLVRMKFPIVGQTPLLMDAFPESVKEDIEKKQLGFKSGKKKVRDLKQEYEDAKHKTAKGKLGFPAAGFKAGMIEATSFLGDKSFSKKLISGAIRIVNVEDGLIPISYKKESKLKHAVGHNTKYSPCFHDWSCVLEIVYDENNISHTDIATLINYAGHYQGVGAWRPKCKAGGSGTYGTYQVKLKK